MQDKFVAFWLKVANKFASNPYVHGFDPLNEPVLAVDSEKNFNFENVGGNAGKTNLFPLYKRIY